MNTKKIIHIVLVVLIVTTLCLVSTEMLEAQCRMCAAGAESNLKNGGSAGRGLNRGILYLLATPYVLVGSLAFIWWRNRSRNQKVEQEREIEALLE